MVGLADVMTLLVRASVESDEEYSHGATTQQLDDLARALGFPLPEDLRHWLQHCNGSRGLHGTFYGAHDRTQDTSIERHLRLFPGWWERRWIPVADDGFGNRYVLDASRSHSDSDAIFFIDLMNDDQKPAYAAASNLFSLLRFLLEDDLEVPGHDRWPHDRTYVIAKDPGMEVLHDKSLLPWNY